MKRFIDTYNLIEGFHRYPNAPEKFEYLAHRHRHMFAIRCRFEVSHNEREIEINEMQDEIKKCLHMEFGSPCEFCGMSCESIAEFLMLYYDAEMVSVKEDDYGGATLTK